MPAQPPNRKRRRPNAGPPDDQSPPPNRFSRGFLFWIVLFAGVMLLYSALRSYTMGEVKEISVNEFYDHLESNAIEAVVIQRERVVGTFRETGEITPEADRFAFDSFEELAPAIDAKIDAWNAKVAAGEIEGEPIDLKYEVTSELLQNFIGMILPTLIIVLLFWFILSRMMRNSGSNVMAFGKSRARMVTREHTDVTFEDVAGIEEAKEEVMELVEFLKNPQRFHKLGGRIPRGVLLVGPPGTGKTLLAKAISGEADVPFFSISGSDFVEMFVGVGASRVRDLFKQATENSPCIIFLDEIDAVGRRRGTGLGGGHDEREQTLNAILVEMDGFDRDESVIVIAATNRPDVLDPALLRPGRFDRQVTVDLPDIKGRKDILEIHARKYKLSPNVDLQQVARGTPNFSGADLEAVMNEAALLASRKRKDAIEHDDLEEARDKVQWGRQRRSRVMEDEDRRITAIHESGHALVGESLTEVEPIHKVTIIPQGPSLGATMSLPEKDRYHVKKKQLLGTICMMLAGRCAEEMFCEDITSGAQNDLERATRLARAMVCQWGMSENIGLVNYQEEEDTVFLGREITRHRTHSEAMAVKIDEEIKRIITAQYERARTLIEGKGDKLERIAEALLQNETLKREDLMSILSDDTDGTPAPDTEPEGDPEPVEDTAEETATD